MRGNGFSIIRDLPIRDLKLTITLSSQIILRRCGWALSFTTRYIPSRKDFTV
jgi:hypothetical protein